MYIFGLEQRIETKPTPRDSAVNSLSIEIMLNQQKRSRGSAALSAFLSMKICTRNFRVTQPFDLKPPLVDWAHQGLSVDTLTVEICKTGLQRDSG